MNLGEKIKRLRKEKNLSQEQLAKMLNVSRQAISKWESGSTYPDISNLVLLRDIFDITLDNLIIDEIKDSDKIKNSKTLSNNSKELENKEDFQSIEDNKNLNIQCKSLEDENCNKELNEEDDLFSSLMVGGFVIGTGLGFITDNFMLGTAFSFIGMGIGYILEITKKNFKKTNIKEK